MHFTYTISIYIYREMEILGRNAFANVKMLNHDQSISYLYVLILGVQIDRIY